jgi:hypothetical protein
MKSFLALFLTYLILVAAPLIAEPQSVCKNFSKEKAIGRVTASAGIFANFWGSEGSVSYESRHAFDRIETLVSPLKNYENICPQKCRARSAPSIYFRSTPLVVLGSYPDYAHCEKLYEQTSAHPLVYEVAGVDSLDSIARWIEKFSRGKGADGKDLYSRCDASCSPRYRYLITKQAAPDATYSLEAEVVCGHARDQEDNNYDLEYGLRWTCELTGGGTDFTPSGN